MFHELLAVLLFGVGCSQLAIVYMRKKDDLWNLILSGAAAGGILSVHQGFPAVIQSSVQGAVILALFSGTGFTVQSHSQTITISMAVNSPVTIPVEKSSHDELFSELFEEKKVQDGTANSKTGNF
jgi:hypothetical protein